MGIELALPEFFAGAGVQRVEQRSGRRGNVDDALCHRRRAFYRMAGVEAPELLAADSVQGVDDAVVGADIECACGDRWAGTGSGVRPEAPELLAAAGINCIDMAIVRANVDDPFSYHGRGSTIVAGPEAPEG